MAAAKHDRLLAALIARLPAATAPWGRDDRVAWLRLTASAFDVVYGACGGIDISAGADGAPAAASSPSTQATMDAKPSSAHAVRRYYVDRDGFAMADGRPIAIEDLPAAGTLWDERSGIEQGDVGAILWRDIGTSNRGLPSGVILKPATQAA